MGVFFSKFEHIQHAINRIPSNARLFAFFLLDNRPSYESYFKVLENNKHWIDELSASSKIFTFMPFSKWTQKENIPGFMEGESEIDIPEDFYNILKDDAEKQTELFKDGN